tara:strand:- start:770 stop:1537 length:768 start_codon:yes stop_codon:yes gene_type:complete
MQYSMSRAKNKTEDAHNKLSSGFKINSAKDDAAGLSLSIQLMMRQQNAHAQVRYAQDGISMAQIAESTMKGSMDMMLDMRDLALQSANGSYSDDQRQMLDQEFSALQSEITRQWSQTSTNPNALMESGHLSALYPSDKDMQQLRQPIDDAMRDLPAQDISTQDHAQKSIEVIDQAMRDLSSAQAQLGASQNVMQHRMNSEELAEIHLAESQSRIRDTEFGEELIQSTINSTKTNISVALQAQANASEKEVLRLIK